MRLILALKPQIFPSDPTSTCPASFLLRNDFCSHPFFVSFKFITANFHQISSFSVTAAETQSIPLLLHYTHLPFPPTLILPSMFSLPNPSHDWSRQTMSSHSGLEREVASTQALQAWIEEVFSSVIYLQAQNGEQVMIRQMSVLLASYDCVRMLSLSWTKSTLYVAGIERTLRHKIFS